MWCLMINMFAIYSAVSSTIFEMDTLTPATETNKTNSNISQIETKTQLSLETLERKPILKDNRLIVKQFNIYHL